MMVTEKGGYRHCDTAQLNQLATAYHQSSRAAQRQALVSVHQHECTSAACLMRPCQQDICRACVSPNTASLMSRKRVYRLPLMTARFASLMLQYKVTNPPIMNKTVPAAQPRKAMTCILHTERCHGVKPPTKTEKDGKLLCKLQLHQHSSKLNKHKPVAHTVLTEGCAHVASAI